MFSHKVVPIVEEALRHAQAVAYVKAAHDQVDSERG